MKRIINAFAVLLAGSVLASCLDQEPSFDPKASNNVIEFSQTSTDVQISNPNAVIPVFTDAFDISPADKATIVISYAGAGAAPQDITVTVEVDPSAIERYNTWHKEFNKVTTNAYVQMPAAWYSIPTKTVTIPKGQVSTTFTIDVKPDQFTFASQFVIPLRITQVSSGTVSGNFGSGLFFYQAKNELDGTYKYMTSANTSLVPNKVGTARLQTVGRYRVKLLPGLLATYSNEVFYTWDPVTKRITVECPSLGVQEPQDPRSNFDPATRKMVVFWKQGNGARTFEETFEYTGPR